MAWFGFGKKKAAEIDPSTDPSFRKGQEAAQAMAADMERFFKARFGHMKEAYLKILSDGFDRDMDQEEHSPLLCARANFSVFIENVGESKPRMKGEIMGAMSEWSDFMEQVVPGYVEQLADASLGSWQLDMQTAGMKLMMDRADEFKTIDDRWRRRHAEQAALEPLD